jgi:hypothetical protein
MTDSPREFDLQDYRRVLGKAKALGFVFQTFSQYLESPASKVVLLRHDVDVSLRRALQMADIERAEEVTSTYFVRVHASLYNLFDKNNFGRLQKLAAMGFEIGVHQEVSNFARPGEEEQLLHREKLIIETILGRRVAGLATHVPKENTLEITPELLERNGFDYAPDLPVFNDGAMFVSDSNNHWKAHSIDEALESSDKVLANIHPIWWTTRIKDVPGMIAFLRSGN